MARPRSLAAFLSVCVLTIAFPALAQTDNPSSASQVLPSASTSQLPTTTVHAASNLVLVDVVVNDHGKPVRSIDRKRFHVFEDGKERPLSSFDEHQPSPAPADAASVKAQIANLPPHMYTNVPAYPDAGVVNVLLLDALNTPMANQAEARRQMIQYLGTIPPGTSLAVFTLTSQLRLVEGFTTDAARLTAVLKSKAATSSPSVVLDTPGHSAQQTIEDALSSMADPSHMPSAEVISALQQFETDLTATQLDLRVRTTLDAMDQLARYLSAIPGRKNLIWFSASFPISFDPDPDQPLPFLAVRTYADDIRKTSDLMTAARVAVYPVDARGLITPSTADAAYSPNQVSLQANSGGKVSIRSINDSNLTHEYDQAMTQNMEEHGSMQQVAEQTGGTAYFNDNDLKGAVAAAVATAPITTLSLSLPARKWTGTFAAFRSSSMAQTIRSRTGAATMQTPTTNHRRTTPAPSVPSIPLRCTARLRPRRLSS
jgi:VWFA-related protein